MVCTVLGAEQNELDFILDPTLLETLPQFGGSRNLQRGNLQ